MQSALPALEFRVIQTLGAENTSRGNFDQADGSRPGRTRRSNPYAACLSDQVLIEIRNRPNLATRIVIQKWSIPLASTTNSSLWKANGHLAFAKQASVARETTPDTTAGVWRAFYSLWKTTRPTISA